MAKKIKRDSMIPGEIKELKTTPEEEVRARINRAFYSMPFGGVCHFQYLSCDDKDDEKRLAVIADNLEKLSGALMTISAEANAKENELREYRAAMRGLKFLFNKMKEGE